MIHQPKNKIFLSTLSLRRATTSRPNPWKENCISIHALLAESDIVHALKLTNTMLFLSTLSLRRATCRAKTIATKISHFYPRSPCGERQQTAYFFGTDGRISIHALLAESDSDPEANSRAERQISIHALLAESDQMKNENANRNTISIHALLAESDITIPGLASAPPDFYPRSPCGERRQNRHQKKHKDDFYPRSPCGERLTRATVPALTVRISIHALLAESDVHYDNYNLHCVEISIHALLAESDA